jgi:hypothetical protein
MPKWYQLIKISFLSQTMRNAYLDLLTERSKRLGFTS